MRRLWLFAWPLVLYYFGAAFTVLAQENSSEDDIRLTLSIRKEALRRRPSTAHTFTNLELRNIHPTEDIVIHSVQSAPEETVMLRSASGEFVNTIWDSIPQQLHVSRLPSGSLSLAPGQVAIIPLTFLPRYPNQLAYDNHSLTTREARTPPSISAAARADLADLLGEDVLESLEKQTHSIYESENAPPRRRSNLDSGTLPPADEFEVNTSIVVDTSRGVLKMAVTASSMRENPYSLPDTIRFHHPKDKPSGRNAGSSASITESPEVPATIGFDGTILLDSAPFYVGANARNLKKRPTQKSESSSSRDCYDLYLNNPSDETDLEISEIMVSRPDLMSVEFDPSRLLLSPDLQVISTPPSHVIREWTEEGPMHLPADSVDNYIVTICTAPDGVEADKMAGKYQGEMANWIDVGDDDLNLGFVQIRTDAETLFIVLERDPGDEMALGQNHTTKASKVIQNTEGFNNLLKAKPGKLQLRLLSTNGPPVSASIGLQNKSPMPIRIMRVAVTLDGSEDKDITNDVQRLRLEINATRSGDGTEEIPAAAFLEEAIILTCRTNADPVALSLHRSSFNFTGSVIIRGTMDTELGYDDWKEETRWNPRRDIHVTVEVPYRIVVLNGRIEVTLERSTHPYPQIFGSQGWDRSGRAVSTLFFPLKRFDGLEGSESPLPTQKYMNSRIIGHDLRVMSNVAVPLKLESVEVVDEIENIQSRCDRFNVSMVKPFGVSKSYPEFEDLGYITLQYKFDLRKENSWRNPDDDRVDISPTKCFLNIVTSPSDSRVHQIPLIIFPAEFDISSPSQIGSAATATAAVAEGARGWKEWDQHTGRIRVGFKNLLEWCTSTRVGHSFLRTLGAASDRKAYKKTELVLDYIRKLLDLNEEAGLSNVKPILFEIGAIEHEDVTTSPLVFTNYNPVPITVTIDVAKVEGMSISLAQDGSQGRGDGFSLFDFLPTRNPNHERTVAGEGNLKGHPVSGLLQFLLTNANAATFAERFRFRDSVFLSKEAVSRFPLLEPLYSWHAYAQFHRSDVDEKNPLTVSNLLPSPPDYSMTSNRPVRAMWGPAMISDDVGLLRELGLPDGDEKYSTKVMIPPGGAARFEVRIRSPPISEMNCDITHLLATGLQLSTSFGQILPIFSTIKALNGRLRLSRNSSSLHGSVVPDGRDSTSAFAGEKVVNVAVGLNWHSSSPSKDECISHVEPCLRNIVAEETGIPLLLSSTFSRRIRLLDVESCNPWFHVELNNSIDAIDISSDSEIFFGSVHSSASCVPSVGKAPMFPSFYQCLINWLARRNELQPTGCGALPTKSIQGSEAALSDMAPQGVRDIALAFEIVMKQSESTFTVPLSTKYNYSEIDRVFQHQPQGAAGIKSGKKLVDGAIDSSVLDMYAEAWNAHRVADWMGLTKLSSSLRAAVEYSPMEPKARRNESASQSKLSLSLQDLVIQSSLVAPRLVDSDETRAVFHSYNASVVHLPAALVGSVVQMKIPLRNPTSVPIKVRLVSTPPGIQFSGMSRTDSLRTQFLQSIDAPYVQKKRGSNKNEDGAHDLWWDGGGTFFLPDEHGDLVRTHHNISIRAGAGAHISLVNPSLHSISAFVVGCGSRCGMRDESKTGGDSFDMRQFSIIGASAAASITLAGRSRSALPQNNELSSDEPYIHAGGTPIPGSMAPRAFAIPFSALDEVVLPPFGTGEIGPILFRPPGRSLALGCDVARLSGSGNWGVDAGRLCATDTFSSMVLLENSLTGIERITVKGRAQVEHLYFLDAPSREDDESFGDIELRNGYATLTFSGSGEKRLARERVVISPAIKEAFLHNGGDVPITVKSVHLTKANKKRPSSTRSCELGSFRLLNCFESDRQSIALNGNEFANAYAGFELQPGASQPLFVEHLADCQRPEEYIFLNVEFFGRSNIIQSRGSLHKDAQHSSFSRNGLAWQQDDKVYLKTTELALGYSMDDWEKLTCSAVNSLGFESTWSHPSLRLPTNATKRSRGFQSRRRKSIKVFLRKLLQLLVVLFSSIMAATMYIRVTDASQKTFGRATLKPKFLSKDERNSTSEKRRPSQQSFWNATFRCLARADPTSLELQTLAREQIRQVVAGRYRTKGGSPPLSLANSGAFTRERALSITQGEAPRQSSTKEGNGTERARTLSDALFRTFSPEQEDGVRRMIPAGLGWRVAFARGIINDKSISLSVVAKETNTLFDTRDKLAYSNTSDTIEEGSNASGSELSVQEPELESKEEDPISKSTKVHTTASPTPAITLERVDNREKIETDTELEGEEWARKEFKKMEKGNHVAKNWKSENGRISHRKLHSPDFTQPLLPVVSSHDSSVSSDESVQKRHGQPIDGLHSKTLVGTEQGQEDCNNPVKAKQQGKQGKSGKKSEVRVQGDPSLKPKQTKNGSKGGTENERRPHSETVKTSKKGDGKRKHERKKPVEVAEPLARSKETSQAASLSPPPGIAPPPGFAQDGEAVGQVAPVPTFPVALNTGQSGSATLGDVLTAALHSDLQLISDTVPSSSPFPQPGVNPSNQFLFGPSLGETPAARPLPDADDIDYVEHAKADGSCSGYNGTRRSPSGDPLLDALLTDRHNSQQDEFDVMDFLDSILEDAGRNQQETNLTQGSSLLAPASELSLASNPWATEIRSSRAAAYGINVDEPDGADESSAPAPFPLLTPAAILMSGRDDEDIDTDDEDRGFSFYTNLTEEE